MCGNFGKRGGGVRVAVQVGGPEVFEDVNGCMKVASKEYGVGEGMGGETAAARVIIEKVKMPVWRQKVAREGS